MTQPWVPQACTLPTAERPLRLEEFDALFLRSAPGGQRVSARNLRVLIGGDARAAAAVRDLAAREAECCSFFTFSISTPDPGWVQLDIEVPAGHVEVLDVLERRAKAVRGQR